MSRILVLALGAAACGAAAFAVRGCDDAAKPPAPVLAPTLAPTLAPAAPAQGTANPTPPDVETLAERAKKSDEVCRGLLDSFERRAYDPRRDARLEHAEGTIDVRAGEKEAKYRFVYDASRPAKEPVLVEPVSEPPGLRAGLIDDVRRWAILSCAGGYAYVVCYRPPIQLTLLPSTKKGSFTIYAPPFKTPAAASYSVDERQVVEARSEWIDTARRFTTNYEWTSWHGLYLMRRSVLFKGPTTDFDYVEAKGLWLVSDVHVRDDDRRAEAHFKYAAVRARSN